MEIRERHFSIDPGEGKKMDGCPYSIFEDGHDVKDFIIPPKGYVFTGFRFDPNASNQIYDGKLVAEYTKEPLNEKLRSNLWKVLLALGILAVIAGIVLLAVGVFKGPKSSRPAKTPQTEVIATDTLAEEAPTVATEEAQTVEETVAPAEEPKEEPAPEVKEEEKPVAAAPATPFQKEFWDMIHRREVRMDPYDSLYKANRNKEKGEEYDYLRFTILKDFPAFKSWAEKLRSIPSTEAEQIQDINTLKQKIKATE